MVKANLKEVGSSGRAEELATPTDLKKRATTEIAKKLNKLVADSFVLYLKTKNFHWHVSGPHFAEYHKLFDDQAAQIYAAIDPLAERVRKLGERTILGVKQISEIATLEDELSQFVPPARMLEILINDNRAVVDSLRKAHKVCDEHDDVATASLIEMFIDETEKRIWFLFEASRPLQADH